jgi:hypothetical protein
VRYRACVIVCVLFVLTSTAHATPTTRVLSLNLPPPPPHTMPALLPAHDEIGEDPEAAHPHKEGTTIYLRHLQLAVSTVMRERTDLRDLFSAEEKALAAPFLPAQDDGEPAADGDRTELRGPLLSREARGLYTRMLQRKGPWFRLDSLIKYNELLSDWQEGGATGVAVRERWQRAQRAVAELEACSLVSCIATHSSPWLSTPAGYKPSETRANPEKREVLEAVSACLR